MRNHTAAARRCPYTDIRDSTYKRCGRKLQSCRKHHSAACADAVDDPFALLTNLAVDRRFARRLGQRL